MKKAILISATYKGEDVEANLSELEQLANSVGIKSVAKFWQVIDSPLPAYLGKGKLENIARHVKMYKADGIIADDELSVEQKSKLEKALGVEVLDRTEIILQNFSRSARTGEGKTEVELATLEYKLSHLKGANSRLSRTGGGIGTRGPGESKLESDRRAIREKIRKLKKKISRLSETRSLNRKKRSASLIAKVSIAGYTNAGKSMLLRRLSGYDVKSEDKLFTTLEPTTKRVWLGENVEALVSDTVGFISKLPTQLVRAFHSTLEEVSKADLILLVVDGSDEKSESKLEVAEKILKEVGAKDVPRILVINKIDLCDQALLKRLSRLYPTAVFISAKEDLFVDELILRTREKITEFYIEKEMTFTHEEWSKVSRTSGVRILNAKTDGFYVKVKIKVHPAILKKVVEKGDVVST